jgi:hypothetical protein
VKAHLSALTGETFHCHINKGQPCEGWKEALYHRHAAKHKPTKLENEVALLAGEMLARMEDLALEEQRRKS